MSATTDTDIERQIRQYILDDILMGQEKDLGNDDDLLLSGLVDSFGAMRLVSFLEQDLDIAVPPEDLVFENFQTVGNIADYVRRRRGSPA